MTGQKGIDPKEFFQFQNRLGGVRIRQAVRVASSVSGKEHRRASSPQTGYLIWGSKMTIF